MNDQTIEPTHEEIAALAKQLWQDEGEPEGKAEDHWKQAEEQLREGIPSELLVAPGTDTE